MKKILFLCAIYFIFFWGIRPGLAVPNLQIYIPGATYDSKTETWVINSYDYDLWVIGSANKVNEGDLVVQDVKIALAVPNDEDGSIKLKWLPPNVGMEFTMTENNAIPYSGISTSYSDDNTYSFANNLTPLKGNGDEIPRHGVFPSDFYEYYIGDFIAKEESIKDYSPDSNDSDTNAWGEVKKMHINVSGYSWVDIVAYDHIEGKNHAKYVFSPFSHDGGSGVSIPEPTTYLLMGSGVLFCGLFLRRRFV